MDARALALSVLRFWRQGRKTLDDVLDRQLSGPTSPDTRLATELVYGVVRRQGTLDWVLNQRLKKPLDTLPPMIADILRLGTYQLLFLDRIPDAAAINEAVNQAKKHGHIGTAKLTNAVLRNVQRQRDALTWPDAPAARLAALYSLPEWLAAKWLERFDAEAERLAQAMSEPAPHHLRVNTLKVDRAALLAAFADSGIAAELLTFADAVHVMPGSSLSQWPGYQEGWWYVQDLGSIAVGHAVSPQPSQTVVDLCAAPGGKTTHMAALMHDQGRILALDSQARRLERLQRNVARLGISCIETMVGDAATLAPDRQADAVLVDAPCSGLGVMRRKPDIRWRVTPESLAALLPTQQAILRAAAKWVRPGGILVYSTCSTEPEENGDQVAAFLVDHPDFAAVPLPDSFPKAWTANQPVGQVSLLPDRQGTDGFFMARLQRRP